MLLGRRESVVVSAALNSRNSTRCGSKASENFYIRQVGERKESALYDY